MKAVFFVVDHLRSSPSLPGIRKSVMNAMVRSAPSRQGPFFLGNKDGHRNHGFFSYVFAGGGERQSECFTTQGWMMGFATETRRSCLGFPFSAESSLMVGSKREEL